MKVLRVVRVGVEAVQVNPVYLWASARLQTRTNSLQGAPKP